MTTYRALAICALMAFGSACQPTTGTSEAADTEGTLTIRQFTVPTTVQASQPYRAEFVMNSVTPAGTFVQVQQACFTWTTDGPYCFDQFGIDNTRGIVSIDLVTGNPRDYDLQAYLVYRTESGMVRSTNQLSQRISVR